MARPYRPAWPITKHLSRKTGSYEPDGEDTYALYGGYLRLANVMDEFDTRAAEIRASTDLTESGKVKRLRELAEQFREHKGVQLFRTHIAAEQKRAADLDARTLARPKPRPTSDDPYTVAREAFSAMFKEARIADKFEALSPSERRRAERRMVEGGQTDRLAVLLDAGLLDPPVAAMVRAELRKQASPEDYAALVELRGQIDWRGEHDGLTGALPVSQAALDLFERHLDDAASVATVEREGAATAAALPVSEDAVVLTPEQAKDVPTYRAARERAAAEGKQLRIEGETTHDQMTPNNGGGNS